MRIKFSQKKSPENFRINSTIFLCAGPNHLLWNTDVYLKYINPCLELCPNCLTLVARKGTCYDISRIFDSNRQNIPAFATVDQVESSQEDDSMGSMVYVWNQTINKRQNATEIGPSKCSFLYLDLYIYILGHAWIS